MLKILVVDDEKEIAAIVAKFLTKCGYEVIIANSGEQALEVIRSQEDITLLVLDIKMPGITGVGVLQEMAKMNNTTPVIILSGSVGVQENVDELKKLGYDEDEVLYKPIDLNELLEKVKHELSNS